VDVRQTGAGPGWQTVRPDLDTWPYRILAPAGLLSRELTRALAPTLAKLNINDGDFELLSLIRRAGPPFESSPTELSRALNMTTGAMTRRLDRTEAAKYIVRVRSGSDRRGIVIRLTEAGRRVVDDAVDQTLACLAIVLESARGRTAEFEDIIGTILTGLERD
jgi:DNA-binding MarR family transcriptional regulator